MPDEQRQSAALNRFWNELVQPLAADVSADDDLDPQQAATLRRVHALNRTPPPAGARAKVERAKRAHVIAKQNGKDISDMNETNAFVLNRSGSGPLSWAPPRPTARPTPRLVPTGSRWQWASRFATAMLVLLTLGFGFLVFGPGRPNTDQLANLPAIFAPALSSPSAQTDDWLVAITLPPGAFPSEVVGALSHFSVAAGSEGTYDWDCCTGPRLDYIIEGSLTIRGAGPMQVLRGSGGAWEEMAPETEIVLGEGDALYSRYEDTFESVNAGSAPVELLEAGFLAEPPPDDPVPHESSGIPSWKYQDQDIMWGGAVSVPAGPVTMRIADSTLAAGASLPLPLGAIIQLVVTLDTTSAVGTNGDFGVKNIGQDSATIYVLTVEAEDAASGTSGTGTPMP